MYICNDELTKSEYAMLALQYGQLANQKIKVEFEQLE